jgi:pimeloyl-ACP methyl ester carboxylesterase
MTGRRAAPLPTVHRRPMTVTPLVLVHGGSFAGSCWDLLIPHVDGPVLAVDLPGRESRPAPLRSVTIDSAAASVAADVDAAGFDRVVLVGHSLAGCSMPAMIGRLGERVSHAVFVACTVPEDGMSAVDTLPPDIQALTRAHLESGDDGVLDAELAKALFGNDLDDVQFAWLLERMTPEAPGLLIQPVDLSPLRSKMPRTWVRPLHDAIVEPDKQLRFAREVGHCDVIDLDAGHMCMISKPRELAAIVSDIAARPSPRRVGS